MEPIAVSMRDFIGPPYQICPKCEKETFGVMMINPTSYLRRCRDCWHGQESRLPKLRKKIVYLDQFVVSEIMKLRNPESKGHAAVAADPFWEELDTLLSKLRHLQLICCPSSGGHEDESLLSPFYANLKKTYDSLSEGTSFDSSQSIQFRQVVELAEAWARQAEPVFCLEPSRIINGEPYAWTNRFYVTISSYKEQFVDTLREDRDKLHEATVKIFENTWKVHIKTFAEWFDLEKNSYQSYMLKNFYACQLKKMNCLAEPWKLSLEDALDSHSENVMQSILDIMHREARERPELNPMEMAKTFLTEFRMALTPFNKIGAAMYASIAIKAAAGQKKPPNKGMIKDIEIVSTLLPYCHAMFMDNGCRAILMDIPHSHKPEGVERVFSRNNRDEFLTFLRSIKASTTSEHLTLIREVYGSD